MVPMRTFEIAGRTVSRVGLGTNRLTDTDQNREFLRSAVDAGLGFIDTAHLYTDGASEATVGAALAPFPEDVVVATKGGYRSNEADGLRSEIEGSLDRLRTDRIDLWYLHRIKDDAPFERTLGVISEFVDAGRIAHVGLSEVGVDEIERARSELPVVAVQNEYGLAERKHDEVIDYCETHGIVFVPFFPLAGEDTDELGRVAAAHDATLNQIRLAWLLHRSPVVAPIPGTLSPDHLRENLAATEIDLSVEEIEAIG
ncbi:MAG: aldo/keto reductase [Solirubrobacterales bacterium]|nr:aldo/keto reductase [Solirubrobacterales bacterium]